MGKAKVWIGQKEKTDFWEEKYHEAMRNVERQQKRLAACIFMLITESSYNQTVDTTIDGIKQYMNEDSRYSKDIFEIYKHINRTKNWE